MSDTDKKLVTIYVNTRESQVEKGKISYEVVIPLGFEIVDQRSSEFLYRFEADTISRNTRPSNPDCFCAARSLIAAGDRKPFLGLTWRAEA